MFSTLSSFDEKLQWLVQIRLRVMVHGQMVLSETFSAFEPFKSYVLLFVNNLIGPFYGCWIIPSPFSPENLQSEYPEESN